MEELGSHEVPDLMTGPPKSAARGVSSSSSDGNTALSFAPPLPKPQARKLTAPSSSSSFDDDDMGGSGMGSIDLASNTGGDSASPDSVPEWARPKPPSVRPPGDALPASAAAPHAASALLASEDGGHEAAVRLADYGAVPAQWWQSPMYAYRVKMRQMELRRVLAERRANLDKAHAAADDALIVVAERGRKTVFQKEGYAKLIDAVLVAEGALREKDGAHAAETDAYKQKTGAVDDRLVAVEAEVRGVKTEEQAVRVAFDRVEAVRQRAEAMLKRAEIDLRAAIARAAPPSRKSLSEAAAPPNDPDVVTRTAERDARLADLQRATPAVTELMQKLTVAKKSAAANDEKILALKNERAALEEQWKKSGAAHGVEVAKAQKEVRTAMSSLGRTMMGDMTTFGAEWSPVRSELIELDKVIAIRDDEVLLHVMALDAAHKKTVQTGVALAGGAVGLLFLLFLIPVALSLSSSAKRPPASPAATTAPADNGE